MLCCGDRDSETRPSRRPTKVLRNSATDLKTRRMMHACSLERGLTYKGGAEVKLALNTYPGSDAKVCVALLNNSGEHAVTAVR